MQQYEENHTGKEIDLPFEVSYKGDFACFKLSNDNILETGFTKEGLESIYKTTKALGLTS